MLLDKPALHVDSPPVSYDGGMGYRSNADKAELDSDDDEDLEDQDGE